MIHSGGVIGAGVPQFQSQTFKKLRLNLPYFRSDRYSGFLMSLVPLLSMHFEIFHLF